MTAGMSTEQTVRQGRRQVAAILAALFDSDPALNVVSITGTLPAVSTFATRAEYDQWNRDPANLPNLRVAASLQ